MSEEIRGLIIGGGVGIAIIGLILFAAERIANAKRAKETKRKANDEDHIAFELPSVGYDSSGYHFPTELEARVANDTVEIKTIQLPENLQKKIDAKRKRRSEKKSCGIRHQKNV